MDAVMTFGKESIEVTSGKTIESIVSSLGKFPDVYIYLVNGKPVPMTTSVKSGDKIEAIRIASGG